MADGKGRDAWQHTSAILTMMHNVVPGMKQGDMKSPDHFNPYKRTTDNDIEVPIEALKAFLQPGIQ